ncbi:MAG: Type 1 glutamine amidotransferase-like domain-containing protein [Opitutaceae bacterium]
MNISRRTFLTTVAAAGAVAALPAHVRSSTPSGGDVPADGLFPAKPNFHTSSQASVMISGGSITVGGKVFTDAIRAAHKLQYGDRKKILLVLHASEPSRRDSDEKKLAELFGDDGFTVESLHHYAGRAALKKIAEAEAFFVSGGETFLLLRTLYASEQLEVLRERVLSGVPYNGTSAGANVAGPNIGCTNDFPVVDVPTRLSFGLFPAVINPHHPHSDQPDYAGRANKIRIFTRLNPAETVLGIGNGAIARLHAGQVTIEHGPAFLYHAGGGREIEEGPVPDLTALVSKRV